MAAEAILHKRYNNAQGRSGNIVGNIAPFAVALVIFYMLISTSPILKDWLGLSTQHDKKKLNSIVGRKHVLCLFRFKVHNTLLGQANKARIKERKESVHD